MNVILIDDDEDVLSILDYVLNQMGVRAVCSVCPEVLSGIPEINPALILMDVRLRGADGGSLCRNLKTTALTKDIPVVLISAATNLELVATEALADGFIEKPFDLETLEQVVLKYISADRQSEKC